MNLRKEDEHISHRNTPRKKSKGSPYATARVKVLQYLSQNEEKTGWQDFGLDHIRTKY
jgi:hypothetical protein